MKSNLLALLLFISFSSLSTEAETETILLSNNNGQLIEKYSVFTKDNKEYAVLFFESEKKYGKKIKFKKLETSNNVVLSTTIGKGDGRYSKPRSGSFSFKFNNDEKTYTYSGTSLYLRSVYSRLNTSYDYEFFCKLKNKSYVFVKVDIVGSKHVFKIDLTGSSKLLTGGNFIACEQ